MQDGAVDAADALNEIAFWLERELAPTFKVQAFRKAAGIISGLSPDEVAERVHDGRLKSMKGIGDTTFAVVSQAVDGAVPDRLETLRERNTQPLASGGADLRKQLRGDLHSHSDWSDGTTSIELMLDGARFLGREYQALTDHSPSLTVANGLTPERLTEQLDVVAALRSSHGPDTHGPDTPGVRLLSGIEVDILESGELDQQPELLKQLDVVVASVHSKLRADSIVMTQRMLGGIRDRHTNILGHCTGRLISGSRAPRPPSEFDAARVFAACAEHDVAVEINSRPERQDPPDDLIQLALEAGCLFSIDRQDPPDDLIQLALEAGCLFSIDSDAHAPGQLDFLSYGAERAAANGVPAERIVTTWPVDRLLEWTHAKR